MNYAEECLSFDCAGHRLAGVLSRPKQPSGVGLVVVVGGPQYRAGSHRQFVLLARRLAAAGHAVLRFDYRGMGDACGDARDFLAVNDDIGAALAALRDAVPQVQQVALWGLCDGASAALLYLHQHPDAPVAGLCLLNPWVRSAQIQAAAQVKHYYGWRLMERAFWAKLLRGQVGLGRLAELLGNLRTMLGNASADGGAAHSFQQRMAQVWRRGDRPILLVLSGRDLVAREFVETLSTSPAWRDALTRPLLTRLDLPDADHTFSDARDTERVEQTTADWLARLAERPVAARPATGPGRHARA